MYSFTSSSAPSTGSGACWNPNLEFVMDSRFFVLRPTPKESFFSIQALEIIDRHKNDPQCLNQGRVLPVLSNQKMNTYLKEIADACDIKKKMTFHTARHTFATTVTLTNGVPIETVGKMLGHRNLKTTQHYAKILDLKVSEE